MYVVEQIISCLKLFLLKIFSDTNFVYLSYLYKEIKHKIKGVNASVFSRVLRDSTTRFVGSSVGPSVHPSVRPSVRPSVTFYFFLVLQFLASLLLPK